MGSRTETTPARNKNWCYCHIFSNFYQNMINKERVVVPGMRICAAEDHYTSGPGTYVLNGYVYSSLAGFLHLVPTSNNQKQNQKVENVVSVEVHAPGEETAVPSIGDIVTAKITSVNPRFAKVMIECIRDITLNEPFRGQIRKEDIREFEKDKIEMYKSFRPGDIILARVLSMGEASSGYLLSTSENELGVVIAKSEHSGVKMIPVSWTEMQCPKTYNKEFRKIAKVVPENLAETPASQ